MPARKWYTIAPVLGGGKRTTSLEERRLRGEIPGPGPDVEPQRPGYRGQAIGETLRGAGEQAVANIGTWGPWAEWFNRPKPIPEELGRPRTALEAPGRRAALGRETYRQFQAPEPELEPTEDPFRQFGRAAAGTFIMPNPVETAAYGVLGFLPMESAASKAAGTAARRAAPTLGEFAKGEAGGVGGFRPISNSSTGGLWGVARKKATKAEIKRALQPPAEISPEEEAERLRIFKAKELYPTHKPKPSPKVAAPAVKPLTADEARQYLGIARNNKGYRDLVEQAQKEAQNPRLRKRPATEKLAEIDQQDIAEAQKRLAAQAKPVVAPATWHPEYIALLRQFTGKSKADFVIKRGPNALGQQAWAIYAKDNLAEPIFRSTISKGAAEAYLDEFVGRVRLMESQPVPAVPGPSPAAPPAEAVAPRAAEVTRQEFLQKVDRGEYVPAEEAVGILETVSDSTFSKWAVLRDTVVRQKVRANQALTPNEQRAASDLGLLPQPVSPRVAPQPGEPLAPPPAAWEKQTKGMSLKEKYDYLRTHPEAMAEPPIPEPNVPLNPIFESLSQKVEAGKYLTAAENEYHSRYWDAVVKYRHQEQDNVRLMRSIERRLQTGRYIDPDVLKSYKAGEYAPKDFVPPIPPDELARPSVEELLVPPPAAPAGAEVPPARPGAAEGVPPGAGGVVPPAGPSPDDVIKRFTDFIHSPESANLAEMTTQMRSRQLGQRAARLQERVSDLLSKGVKYEKALKQAQTEEMAGKFERPLSTLSESLAEEVRDAAFAKVYEVLKDEPFEQMATAEALSNALQGKGIPRITGAKGGSAYTRLSRVFPPEVIQTLEKGKPLTQSIEDLLMAKAPRPPTRITYPEPQLAGEQLGLGPREMPLKLASDLRTPAQKQMDLEAFKTRLTGGKPRPPSPIAEPPLQLYGGRTELFKPGEPIKLTPDLRTPEQRKLDLEAFRTRLADPPMPPDIADALAYPDIQNALQGSLMPAQTQHIVIRALKEIGLTLMDIGNLLRANKSSFDQSFGRQTGLLIPLHPVAFAKAYTKAWVATFSERAAETSMARIHKDPLFALYDQLGLDFLRELKPPKGQVLKGAEEFGFFAGGERPIQKFTAKIPWVKFSNRGFVTGTNEMSWDLFKQHYQNMLKLNEQYASGALKLGTGKSFSVQKEINTFGRMLEDMTGRGRLGPARELAPALNSFFWSTRLNVGRILTPRYLFHPDPIIRKEAWKIIGAFTASVAGVEVLGEQLGLWEIGKQGHTMGKVRLGNTWFDPWVGFQQFARYAQEMITGTTRSAQSGRIYDVDRIQLTGKFILSKAGPLVGLARLATTGKTYAGKEVDPSDPNQWFEELASLAATDVLEAFQESGLIVGAISIPFAISGVGLVSATGLTDARNKVATEIFADKQQGKALKYEDLSPKQQERVDNSPLVQKKLTELKEKKADSGALLDVSFQNYEAANEEIEAELSAAVKAGASGKVLKDFIQTAKERRWQTAQTTFNRVVEEQLKKGKDQKLKDVLHEQYWAADAPQDMLTGEIDFKARDKTRADVLRRAKEAGIEERFITEKKTPWKDPAVAKAVADLEAAQETLRPYWNLKEQVLEYYAPKYPQLKEAIKGMREMDAAGQPEVADRLAKRDDVKFYLKEVTRARQNYRRINKKADEAGRKWYGWKPLKETK